MPLLTLSSSWTTSAVRGSHSPDDQAWVRNDDDAESLGDDDDLSPLKELGIRG